MVLFQMYSYIIYSWKVNMQHFVFELGRPGRIGTPRVFAHMAIANLWRWCFYVAYILSNIPYQELLVAEPIIV